MLDVVESVQTLLFPVNIPLLVETYTIKPIYYVDSASWKYDYSLNWVYFRNVPLL